MLTLETVCRPHPGVVYQIVDGEAVVVLPQAGQIKVLNEVGTRIWSLLNGSLTIGEIAGRICLEYYVELTRVEMDILEFLTDLEHKEIIQVIGS